MSDAQKKDKTLFYKVGDYICKNCTNNSLAKYRFSFPKSSRFPGEKYLTDEEKKKQREDLKRQRQEEEKLAKDGKYVKHDYYDLPSTLNKRYTKFGYGNRTDFTAGKSYSKKSQENEDKIVKVLEKMEKEKIKNPADIKELKKYYNSLMGVNFPSKFRSNEGRTFGGRHKPKDSRDNNPGPGMYIIPSDFGIYQIDDKEPYKKKEYDDPHPWRHGMKKIVPKKEPNNYENDNQEDQYNPEDDNVSPSSDKQGDKDDKNKEENNQNEGDNNENQEKKENEEDNKDNKEGENNENQENQEKEQNENKEEQKENEEEDKKTECPLLRDILTYPETANPA